MSVQSWRRSRILLLFGIVTLIVLAGGVSAWLVYQRVPPSAELYVREDSDSLNAYLSARLAYVGRRVQEVPYIPPSAHTLLATLLERYHSAGDEYTLIITLGSISCMSCYSHHIGHLQRISSTLSPRIIVLSDTSYFKLIGEDLPVATHLNAAATQFTVILVNSNATTMLLDVADPRYYSASDIFYSAISNLLSSAKRQGLPHHMTARESNQ